LSHELSSFDVRFHPSDASMMMMMMMMHACVWAWKVKEQVQTVST